LKSVVINVSFENGSAEATADVEHGIGARMLYQLRPKAYKVELAALLNVDSSRPFVVVCVAATVTGPVDEWLGTSQQPRHILPVTRLKPPTINQQPVFPTDGNPLLQLLVDDMDGHGRPLEVLSYALADFKSFDPTISVHFSKLMDDVLLILRERYNDWIKADFPVLHAVLCQTGFRDVQAIIPGTSRTVDEVVSYGYDELSAEELHGIIAGAADRAGKWL